MITFRHYMAVMAFSSICLPSVACAANTAWEKYLNFPSAENARLVHKMTYSSHKDNAEEVAAGDLAILRIQVVAGDRAAFGLAYLLMRSSDGGVLEDLQAILASAIRSHPLVFLEEVDRLNIPEKTLESVLLMPGLEYVDRPLAQKYELQMRRNAIGAIARNNLSPIRNKCVAIYDKELRKEG